MATTITCRVATTFSVFIFSVALFAQSKPPASATGSSAARDLNSTLAELIRVAPATNQDLAYLQQQGGILRRVTFWRGEKANNAQMEDALRRNLQFAVPSLIHETQGSGGSVSTTLKLYRDLTVVCESLDSLLPPGSRESKGEWAALNNDLSDMNRLREDLFSYIQQSAASMESKTRQLSSSGRAPKKIIVDENVAEKPAPKKRSIITISDQ
jgi:hypothetical protein